MVIRFDAGAGQELSKEFADNTTLNDALAVVKPAFNLGNVTASVNGVTIGGNDILSDGMDIQLNTVSHSKA